MLATTVWLWCSHGVTPVRQPALELSSLGLSAAARRRGSLERVLSAFDDLTNPSACSGACPANMRGFRATGAGASNNEMLPYLATQRPRYPPPTVPGWFSGKLPWCRSGSFGSFAFGADPLASCNGPTFFQAP